MFELLQYLYLFYSCEALLPNTRINFIMNFTVLLSSDTFYCWFIFLLVYKLKRPVESDECFNHDKNHDIIISDNNQLSLKISWFYIKIET